MRKQTPYERKELKIIKDWVTESLAYLGYHDLMNITISQSPTQLIISHDCDGISQIRYDNNRIYIVDNKSQIKQFTFQNGFRVNYITILPEMCVETTLRTIIQYHRLNIK